MNNLSKNQFLLDQQPLSKLLSHVISFVLLKVVENVK